MYLLRDAHGVDHINSNPEAGTQAGHRPLCNSRRKPEAVRQVFASHDPAHPAHENFDPVSSSLCMRCFTLWRALPAEERAAFEPALIPAPAPRMRGSVEFVDGTNTMFQMSPAPAPTLEEARAELQRAVRFTYDLQKIRIMQGQRQDAGAQDTRRDFMHYASANLEELERDAFKRFEKMLRPFPIAGWLLAQKGVGPAMAAVIVANVDIHKAENVSKLWAWCGLATRPDADGVYRADRRKKGEKCRYNPWLKAKMLQVLGGSFLKTNSPWRKLYDERKHRRENQIVTCMLCEGTGKFSGDVETIDGTVEAAVTGTTDKKMKTVRPCPNCDGTGSGPWGRSDAHRHQDALRYMVKMFLLELYKEWRTLEGLPVRNLYMEEYLGRQHHQ